MELASGSTLPPITDRIPRQSFNILCSPPFTSKRKLLRTAVREYLREGAWLGSVAPTDEDGTPRIARLGYVGADDPGFPSTVPCVLWSRWRDHLSEGMLGTLDAIYQQFPEPRPEFLIVDNIQSYMLNGQVNDYCSVITWGRQLQWWQQANDVTLLGLAPATKTREEEGGYAPHNRILGSVAWAELVFTLWLLDRVDHRVTEEGMGSTMRLLITLSHNVWRPDWTYYDLDSDGWLIPTLSRPVPAEAVWRGGMAQMVAQAGIMPLRTAQLQEWGSQLGISKATVDRWIADMVEEGRMLKLRKGQYEWLDKPQSPC